MSVNIQASIANNSNQDILDFSLVNLNEKDSFFYSFDGSSPIISLDFAFKNAGYALDEKDKLGISYILLYIFKQNEIGEDSERFKTFIEDHGVKIDFSVDQENFYFSFKIINQYKDELLEIIRQILTVEDFNSKILNQAKENISHLYEINKGNAHFISSMNLYEQVFKDTDMAKNPYGDKETLENVTKSDLQKFIKERFTQANLNLSISGNIKESEAGDIYKKIKKNLSVENSKKFVAYNNVQEKFHDVIELKKDQILIKAYFPTIGKGSSNFYKYYIANYVIGGAGLNSILSKVVREEHGLTYSIYSHFDVFNDFSIWVCEMSTDKKNYKKALKILEETFAEINQNGITQEDLDRAKQYLVGNFEIYFNTNEKVSSYLLDAKLRKVSPSIIRSRNSLINSYDLEEINAAIKKFIDPDKLSYQMVGDIK